MFSSEVYKVLQTILYSPIDSDSVVSVSSGETVPISKQNLQLESRKMKTLQIDTLSELLIIFLWKISVLIWLKKHRINFPFCPDQVFFSNCNLWNSFTDKSSIVPFIKSLMDLLISSKEFEKFLSCGGGYIGKFRSLGEMEFGL